MKWNRQRVIWTVVFLPLTVVPIALECWAGFDNSDNTVPWTGYISRYVPWPVAIVVYGVLVVWLPIHFWQHYRLRKAYRQAQNTMRAQRESLTELRTLSRDQLTLTEAADRAEAALRAQSARARELGWSGMLATDREVIDDVRAAILGRSER